MDYLGIFFLYGAKVRKKRKICIVYERCNVDWILQTFSGINKYSLERNDREGGCKKKKKKKGYFISRVEERESIGLLNRTRFRKWIFVGWLGKIIIRRGVYACEDKSRTKI